MPGNPSGRTLTASLQIGLRTDRRCRRRGRCASCIRYASTQEYGLNAMERGRSRGSRLPRNQRSSVTERCRHSSRRGGHLGCIWEPRLSCAVFPSRLGQIRRTPVSLLAVSSCTSAGTWTGSGLKAAAVWSLGDAWRDLRELELIACIGGLEAVADFGHRSGRAICIRCRCPAVYLFHSLTRPGSAPLLSEIMPESRSPAGHCFSGPCRRET